MATLQNVFPAVACYIRPMGASQYVFPEVVPCTGPMEATQYVFPAMELISDMLLYPLHSYLSENVKAF